MTYPSFGLLSVNWQQTEWLDFLASASCSHSKVNNSRGQFGELSSNQSLPHDSPSCHSSRIIIIIINCLGWWLWTSVCGMLNSLETIGIQASSGLLSPWLIPSPAFTAFSSSLFVIFLSLSHNTFTATLSTASLSLSKSWRACAHAHINICQQNKGLTCRPENFFHSLLPGESTKVQSCACHVRTAFLAVHKDYNKLLAWGWSILTSGDYISIFKS